MNVTVVSVKANNISIIIVGDVNNAAKHAYGVVGLQIKIVLAVINN